MDRIRKKIYPIKTVIIVFLIIISTVAIDTAWKISLENSARIQAKFNLAQIKMCTNDLLLTDEDGLLSKYGTKDKKELERALRICAKNMKVSQNGDVWAYDLETKKYVFDEQRGIENRYWTEKAVCKKKQEWCKKLVAIMNSGYDSTWLGYSWLFKHDKEYLEWRVLPDENIGFDGLARSSLIKPQQIVVVQGAREKDLQARYKWFRAFIYGLGFIMIIINLLLAVNERKYGRRKDDT